MHFNTALSNLFGESLVGSYEQLLSSLASGIKGSADLSATKRTIIKEATILSGERDSLSDALVNDVAAHFGKPVHISLTRPKIPPFHGIVKQPMN
jgi:hypothetical protein